MPSDSKKRREAKKKEMARKKAEQKASNGSKFTLEYHTNHSNYITGLKH